MCMDLDTTCWNNNLQQAGSGDKLPHVSCQLNLRHFGVMGPYVTTPGIMSCCTLIHMICYRALPLYNLIYNFIGHPIYC